MPLPTLPGDHKLRFATVIDGRPVALSYLLHLPPHYDQQQRWPVLVFLHGSGECGTDLSAIYFLGPMTLFRTHGDGSTNPAMAATWPFVTLCPQCPPRGQTWSDPDVTRATAELVAAVVHSGGDRLDPDRVYATGLSMGGQGTWALAEAAPDLFAAVAPLSAMAFDPDDAGRLLRSVPAWSVTGLDDEGRFVAGAKAMQQALAAEPVDDRFTFVPHVDHGVFSIVYENGPQMAEWLLAHRRPPPGGHPPTTRPALPLSPGHHLLSVETTVHDAPVQIDYAVFVPSTPPPPDGRWPAVLFLAERDTIGVDLHDLCLHGPDLGLERTPAARAACPTVVISPRLPVNARWTDRAMARALAGLLDHVAAAVIPLDPDRIAISGVDQGAFAAWSLADLTPDRFSALLWVSTRPDAMPPTDNGKVCRAMPGRAYLMPADAPLADRITAEAKSGDRHWSTAPLPPTATPLADLPPFDDPAVYAWLAAQRRSAANR